MSDISSTEKKRRFIMFCLLGVAVAAVILFVSFTLFGPEKPSATATMVAARSEAVTGRAGGEGSEEYNKKLEAHDTQQANAALQAGDSFVPTPVGQRQSVVGKKPDTPPPAPPAVAPVRTAPVQAPRTDNTMLKRMMEDLAALDARLAAASVGTGQIVWLRDFSRDERDAAPVEKTVAVSQTALSPSLAIQPGDLLYAVIETGVNSDVPSAVMATVASGKYRNARLLGGFQRHDERLVLAFNRVVLPTGETAQLEAYAVDPSTSEASVASRVDTHFFSRWGGLVASAFLEGLGTAKRYSGSQSTIYGNNSDNSDQMIWNTYSVADQAWIAAGKVGEKAGKIFERSFDRPPTVYLESGTPVGVLVLNVKENR